MWQGYAATFLPYFGECDLGGIMLPAMHYWEMDSHSTHLDKTPFVPSYKTTASRDCAPHEMVI